MSESKPLKTVVLATDFSEAADGAASWAAELARPHEANMVLVHASLPPMPLAPEFVPLPPDVQRADRERIENELQQRVESVHSKYGLDARGVHRDGIPEDVILEVADEADADVVVVGSRGLTGARRIFLGSTAAHVVRRASCPVLTVHPEHAQSHRPIRTVLVPTDFSADAELAVSQAAHVFGVSPQDAKLKLLHVFRLHPEVTYPWTASYLGAHAAEVTKIATEKLDKMAQPLRDQGFDVEVLVYEGYPPDVIDQTAKQVKADVIAMGTHGRSFLPRLILGSVAERVLPAAPCPVLTVHHPEAS